MLFNLLNSATSLGVHIFKKSQFQGCMVNSISSRALMQVRYFFLVHINNNAIILNVVACIIYAKI